MEPIIKQEHQEIEQSPSIFQIAQDPNSEVSQLPNKKIKKIQKKQNIPEDQRQYVCGCGKGYLSYPALYTHIK